MRHLRLKAGDFIQSGPKIPDRFAGLSRFAFRAVLVATLASSVPLKRRSRGIRFPERASTDGGAEAGAHTRPKHLGIGTRAVEHRHVVPEPPTLLLGTGLVRLLVRKRWS